jgi:hypothetical protein
MQKVKITLRSTFCESDLESVGLNEILIGDENENLEKTCDFTQFFSILRKI